MCPPLTHGSSNVPLPTRDIHLDFHTSEHIPEIGRRFDRAQFQEALRIGHVNQINIFGKGHHSWSYYPTEVGSIHPNLNFDLLGAQIEACHEIGVRCPIYYTVGWSATDAEQHPEWCSRLADGSIKVNGTFDQLAGYDTDYTVMKTNLSRDLVSTPFLNSPPLGTADETHRW